MVGRHIERVGGVEVQLDILKYYSGFTDTAWPYNAEKLSLPFYLSVFVSEEISRRAFQLTVEKFV